MSARSQNERKSLVEAQKCFLGYQPLRMKPVHFATSFFLALTGCYYNHELLNKTANPKPVPRKPSAPDHYVTSQFIDWLESLDITPFGDEFDEPTISILRSHLNSAYNNDGAALAPGYAPYKTFGFDFSTPGPEYLANKSKNHGNAGAMVHHVLNRSNVGRECLALAKTILESSTLPARYLAAPFLTGEAMEAVPVESLISEDFAANHAEALSERMLVQTTALHRTLTLLSTRKPAYALRQMVIGVGSWLLMSLLKRSANGSVLVVPDFTGDPSSRMRVQARACFARQQALFGSILQRGLEDGDTGGFTEEQVAAIRAVDVSKVSDFEEHLNDFALRLGWLQPRSGSAAKHFEILPDTLKVLIMGVVAPGEVIVLEELGQRLLESWHLCLGLRPEDHAFLRENGYSPLDLDADLRRNRDAFKRRLVALGLAEEPSDGLVLVSIEPELIHSR